MRCNRRLCNILFKDNITNEKVCKKRGGSSQAAIGELTPVSGQETETKVFGRVSRSSGSAKTNLQSTDKYR